ncbi:MAG: type II toxin-antitoxin system VapC family toxin [Candidatus Dormibacteria bacterium]
MRRRLERLWVALDALPLEMMATDWPVVMNARALMAVPGLPPRDAFHAAHALESDCGSIASADRDFDRIPGLTRLGPARD